MRLNGLNSLFVTLGIAAGLALSQPAPAPAPAPGPLQFPPEFGDHLVLPLRAKDGDTVVFCWLVQDDGRLYGINAPEAHGATAAQGKASGDYLQSLLTGKPMRAKVRGREKYGRCLLQIFDDRNQDLSDLMIQAQKAKPWDGKGVRP